MAVVIDVDEQTSLIPQHNEFINTTREADETESRPNYAMCCFKSFFMIFFAVLFPLHLFCLGISVVFDTVCVVKEATSLVNCSEKVIFAKPQPLVLLCWLTTIINTIVVLTMLHLKPAGIDFCGLRIAFGRLVKKGSFWSFNIMFILSILEYIIVMCKHLGPLNVTVATTFVVFTASRLIAAYSINYLPPVRFPNVGERYSIKLYTCLAYWVILTTFLLDTAHAALAVTLDVAEKVTPLGNVHLGSRNFNVVARLVLLGIHATFEVRLFLFFWNKLFHGEKDLLSTALILKSIQTLPSRNIESNDDDDDVRIPN